MARPAGDGTVKLGTDRQRAALRIAAAAYDDLPDEPSHGDLCKATERAFAALGKIKGLAHRDHIVASALYAKTNGISLDEVHPMCVGAVPWLAFGRAREIYEMYGGGL